MSSQEWVRTNNIRRFSENMADGFSSVAQSFSICFSPIYVALGSFEPQLMDVDTDWSAPNFDLIFTPLLWHLHGAQICPAQGLFTQQGASEGVSHLPVMGLSKTVDFFQNVGNAMGIP